MAMMRWIAAALPRLAGGQRRATTVCNLPALLAVALAGTSAVHLLAYHVPPGMPFDARWTAAALQGLIHCPLLGPLGLVAMVVTLAARLALVEVQRLERLHSGLTLLLLLSRRRNGSTHDTPAPDHEPLPRSPWRLAGFVAALLGLQVTLFSLAGLLCPMRAAMVMGGATMMMPVAPALPLAPLHLCIAVICGFALWRIERRLTSLRVRVAEQVRLLSAMRLAVLVRPIVPREARLPHPWDGSALHARPPPLAA